MDSKPIEIINSIMQEKSATSSKQFGLGKVADDIESMPIDPTTLKPNRYPERVLTKNDTKKKKNRRRGARGKRAARRRLIGIVTVSALRNLFESTLVAIDPGLYFTRQQSIIIVIFFFCFS